MYKTLINPGIQFNDMSRGPGNVMFCFNHFTSKTSKRARNHFILLLEGKKRTGCESKKVGWGRGLTLSNNFFHRFLHITPASLFTFSCQQQKWQYHLVTNSIACKCYAQIPPYISLSKASHPFASNSPFFLYFDLLFLLSAKNLSITSNVPSTY